MSKNLVAYFSASGVTRSVAEKLCEVVCGDLFEIVPETLYTKEGLDYTNPKTRCTVEMNDLTSRPAVVGKVENLWQYETVFVGFPVWWGREPSVVDTFLDENDLTDKKVVVFVTSGSSPVDGSVDRFNSLLAGKAACVTGVRLAADVNSEQLADCVKSLGL